MDEIERIRTVYDGYRRSGHDVHWQADRGIHAERRVLLAEVFAGLGDARGLRVLDLGCGRGDLMDELTEAGVDRGNIVGADLLPDRLAEAARRGLGSVMASAGALPFADATFDVVTAFTLVSSIAPPALLRTVGDEIGRVLAPAGCLLLYDMRLPNPANPEVRAVTKHRLRQLFPGWSVDSRSCTLLPPVARRFAPESGRRYRALASFPFLRSHRLSALRPPASAGLGIPALGPDPSVSVILPVRNEGPFIEQSLGAVLHQDPPGLRLEVIVVDGHSADGTADMVRDVAKGSPVPVAVLDNPECIVPVSMNIGLERATGDVVIRVDGHCVIAPDYVSRCLTSLRATRAECVGGPMETVGETPMAAAIAAAQSSRFGVGGVAFRTSDQAGFVDTLAFGAYRREVFDQIGPFDEDLVRNQDDELNLRLTRAGGRIWMDPTIRSTYFSRGDLAGLWRQYHGYGFYKVKVMRKHRTVPSPRHLVPAAFVAATAGGILASLTRRSPIPAASVLVPYLTGLAVSSSTAATEVARTLPVAAATTTMHVAYGFGWWNGARDEVARTARQRWERRIGTR